MEIATGEVSVAIYYLTLAAVLALAAAKGGRFERGMVLTISGASAATVLSQFLFKQYFAIVPFTAIDLIVLVSIVRIWRYHRRLWTYSSLVLQCAAVLVDGFYIINPDISTRFYMAFLNTIYYGILSSIAFGVLRRRIGPPHALPQAPLKKGAQHVPPSLIHPFWLHHR